MHVLSTQLAMSSTSPPSPSLTNPDMILPSYEPSRNSPQSSYFESQPPPSLPLASSPTLHDGHDPKRRSDASLDDFEIPHWAGLGSATVDDLPSPVGSAVGSPFPEEEEGSLSHAALTKRAERILANAKTRLTNMEGNLNRARHSPFLPASSSMPSIASRTYDQSSNYSPPATNGDRQAETLMVSMHRHYNSPFNSLFASSIGDQGHTRVSSETSVPSSLHTPGNTSYGILGEGISGATGSVGSQGLVHSRSYSNRQHASLQPLNEDGPAPASFQYANEMHTRTNGKLLNDGSQYPDQAVSEFDPNFPAQTGLTRSRSTAQMRELRDQMQDLRGKISTLKEQAREDHLRRRSLQSLRNPSPFTAAEQWYIGIGDSNIKGFGVDAEHEWNGVRKPLDDAKENQAELTKLQHGLGGYSRQDHFQDTLPSGPKDGVHSRPDPDRTPDEDQSKVTDTDLSDQRQRDVAYPLKDETENVIEDSEQDDIGGDEEYYEPSSELVSERHEDRPDAFDYQNFFLHSAMGSFSTRRDRRRGSTSSTDSAETTRPNEPVLETSDTIGEGAQPSEKHQTGSRVPPTWHKSHSRQNSAESVSTLNSFATATEGTQSDGEPEEDDWIRNRPMAGAWQPDSYVEKTKPSSRVDRRGDMPRTTTPTPSPQSPQPETNDHTPNIIPTSSSSPSKPTDPSPPRPDSIETATPSPPSPTPPLLVSAFTAPALLPLEDGTLAPALQYSSTDKVLVEALMESFRNICAHLYTAEGSEGGKYAAGV
ncbi:MAG: hypothetical protein FRX48_05468 [Lasallia pustulata]|uniref:Uncharacterized protein n=1 Tax=Lasallia pustulata TaxID=136370 RepID=A0A5M8PRF5_9LECA|nr:MAG: hypothetical protein FRX48_05468 [Lasallia pustulata]